jgi:YHS domain-containing protein
MYRLLLTIICTILLTVAVAAGGQNKKASKSEKARDPVCGLMVEKNPNLSAEYQGQTYYFCTKTDRDKFKEQPQKYVRSK